MLKVVQYFMLIKGKIYTLGYIHSINLIQIPFKCKLLKTSIDPEVFTHFSTCGVFTVPKE